MLTLISLIFNSKNIKTLLVICWSLVLYTKKPCCFKTVYLLKSGAIFFSDILSLQIMSFIDIMCFPKHQKHLSTDIL